MTCIIIGGNAAGMSAASRLKRKSPGARVIVFERTGEVSYGACGMPYYIAGFNDSLDKMRIRKPEAFLEQGIDLRLHATVTGIDAVNRRVLWRDAAGECAAEAYDQLVIASGASPIVPPIKGTDLDGVFTLKTLPDAARIRECIENPGVRSVAIVGGGYIGLELAEACLRQKKTVHVFEGLPRLLNTFDPEFSAAVTDTLRGTPCGAGDGARGGRPRGAAGHRTADLCGGRGGHRRGRAAEYRVRGGRRV